MFGVGQDKKYQNLLARIKAGNVESVRDALRADVNLCVSRGLAAFLESRFGVKQARVESSVQARRGRWRRYLRGPIPAVHRAVRRGIVTDFGAYVGRRRAATRADLMSIKAMQIALQHLLDVVVPEARQAV